MLMLYSLLYVELGILPLPTLKLDAASLTSGITSVSTVVWNTRLEYTV